MKTEMVKLVTFQLGKDRFAADVFSVERALRYVAPSSVPDVPGWLSGVIDHGGKVIPVVDMRRRIELPEAPVTSETRMLILTTLDGWVAAVVDAVHEVALVPTRDISPPPKMFRGLSAEFVSGIAKVRDQLVVVLDVDRVLASADRIAFEAAVQNGGLQAGVEVVARG